MQTSHSLAVPDNFTSPRGFASLVKSNLRQLPVAAGTTSFYRLTNAEVRGDSVDLLLVRHCESTRGSCSAIQFRESLIGCPVRVYAVKRVAAGAPYLEIATIEAASADEALPSLNLARLEWISQPADYTRLLKIVDTLSEPYRLFLNDFFRVDDMLGKFVSVPASCSNHHSKSGGLLEHSVDTAEIAGFLAGREPSCDYDTAVVGALLHDVGKVDEYVQGSSGRWYLSDTGQLIGHKATGIGLLHVALKHSKLSLDRQIALLHAVTASKAGEYAGMRAPKTPEAEIIAAADRASAELNFYSMRAKPGQAWGKQHPHSKGAPYFVAHTGNA